MFGGRITISSKISSSLPLLRTRIGCFDFCRSRVIPTVDLCVAVVVGLCIGYLRQRFADSGELHLDKLLMSIFISTLSFVLAYTLIRSFGLYEKTRFAGICVAVLGGAFCSLNLHVIYYAISNLQYKESRSLAEYFAWILPGVTESFIVAFIVYSLFAVFVIVVMRILLSSFSRDLRT